MITLSPGLKNSLLVLEHLRDHEDLNRLCDIQVGTFTNNRESGLTFAVVGYCEPSGEFIHSSTYESFTYCVYEHRSSDRIILNGKPGFVSANGDLPYKGDSSSNVIASFRYDEHYKCAEKLVKLILLGREDFLAEAAKPKKTTKKAPAKRKKTQTI